MSFHKEQAKITNAEHVDPSDIGHEGATGKGEATAASVTEQAVQPSIEPELAKSSPVTTTTNVPSSLFEMSPTSDSVTYEQLRKIHSTPEFVYHKKQSTPSSDKKYRRPRFKLPPRVSGQKAVCGRPEIGKMAPHFCGTAVVNGQFKEINLTDYKGYYVVLCFYKNNFISECRNELLQFSALADEFSKAYCQIIGVSTDSKYSHLAWIRSIETAGNDSVKFPLLADKNAKISKDYAVYLNGDGTSMNALFIIDDLQNLRQITVHDSLVERDIREILRLVGAFKYTDVTRVEFLQVGWKKEDSADSSSSSDDTEIKQNNKD